MESEDEIIEEFMHKKREEFILYLVSATKDLGEHNI